MRHRYLILLLPLIALLYGCASTMATDLRASPALTYEVDVNVNYQLVHERILSKLRECNGEGGVGGPVIFIPNEIYTEKKKSSIAWVMAHGGLQKYNLQIDINATNADETHIQAFAIHNNWQKTLDLIESWATNPDSGC